MEYTLSLTRQTLHGEVHPPGGRFSGLMLLQCKVNHAFTKYKKKNEMHKVLKICMKKIAGKLKHKFKLASVDVFAAVIMRGVRNELD